MQEQRSLNLDTVDAHDVCIELANDIARTHAWAVAAPAVILFHIQKEGEEILWSIDLTNVPRFRFGLPDAKPTIHVHASEDILIQLHQEKLNPAMAADYGMIKVTGDTGRFLRLAHAVLTGESHERQDESGDAGSIQENPGR